MTPDTPALPIPFPVFVSKLLVLYSPPFRARATWERMRYLSGLLSATPGINTTADLTTSAMAAFLAGRSAAVKANTVIGEIGYLRSLCAFAVEEGWLARNPFESRRLRVRPEPSTVKSHHTLSEVSRVLSSLRDASATWTGGRLFALASTVAYTGLRRNEALFLRAEDADLSAGLLAVLPRGRNRLKTVAAAAPVPVCPELAEVLGEWLPRCGSDWLFPTADRSGPWTGGNPGTKPLDRLKAAGRKVGVLGLTWKSLRHSWATHAETAWGLPEAGIQRVLRHTTPLTSRRYRHADGPNLVRMVRGVTYRIDPPHA